MKGYYLAEPHGFCGHDNLGVKRALRLVTEAAAKGDPVYCLGEIVHNQRVVDWLTDRYGVKTVASLAKVPVGAHLLIRAHGARPEVFTQAVGRGLKVIDATCPLVTRVHQEVKKLAAVGEQIIYVASKLTHDEAVGVAAEAPKAVQLVTLADLPELEITRPEATVVLTQTTLSIFETEKAFRVLKKRYPRLKVRPHLCLATTQRQKAVKKLVQKVGLVLIVGSTTSSNTTRLKEVAEQAGAVVYLVGEAGELKRGWLKGREGVGISSGASVPEWQLAEIIDQLEKWGYEKGKNEAIEK